MPTAIKENTAVISKACPPLTKEAWDFYKLILYIFIQENTL
jgi:hypothetical protein